MIPEAGAARRAARLWFLNIRRGAAGGRFERLLSRAAALRPDIAVFAEAEGWSGAPGARFARTLGLDLFVAPGRSGLDAALLTRPGWLEGPARALAAEVFRHGACRATIAPPGRAPFDLYAVHFHPKGEERRALEVEALLAETGRPPARPTLVVGDLNAVRASDRIGAERADAIAPGPDAPAWLRDKVPPRALDALLAAGFADLLRERRPAEDGFTYPASAPVARYDYALASAAMAARVLSIDVLATPADVALSDHLGLLVEVE
jgi:endonuclease/exonuclease/phosphatase family metal-dependent hydrolase